MSAGYPRARYTIRPRFSCYVISIPGYIQILLEQRETTDGEGGTTRQFQLNKYPTHRDTFLYSPYLLLASSQPCRLYLYTRSPDSYSSSSSSSSALSSTSSHSRLFVVVVFLLLLLPLLLRLLSELVLYKSGEKETRTLLTNAFLRHLALFSIRRPVVELPEKYGLSLPTVLLAIN